MPFEALQNPWRSRLAPNSRRQVAVARMAGTRCQSQWMNDRKILSRKTRAVEQDSSLDQSAPFQKFEATLHKRISEIGREDWDACHNGNNPFISYDFLDALEESGSVAPETGWLPQHLAVRDANTKEIVSCVPLYLKSHSYGEYVFDHSWAEAHDQAAMMGGSSHRYYPKLQSCVPFTPVTGTRILAKSCENEVEIRKATARSLASLPAELGVSSVHVSFCSKDLDVSSLESAGFLQRQGIQYHWRNQDYSSFEDFLGTLKQKKRKSIRQERKRVSNEGLKIRRLSGEEVRSEVIWDRFYQFYLNTSQRKWGVPYLNREFFSILSERLADQILLILAESESRNPGHIVAGALNLVGQDAIYGRNWGCETGDSIKGLHFELCFYQAIEEAIERGLPRVEAGAQGEHKLQRGYLPVATHSMHFIADPGFKEAIRSFLMREERAMKDLEEAILRMESPYK